MELIEFKDEKAVPDIVHPYGINLRNNSIPLVIDNGNKPLMRLMVLIKFVF